MYVDPSIEDYVFVYYCGLFITKRKADAEFEENRPTTQPLCERGTPNMLRTGRRLAILGLFIVNYMSQNYSYLNR